MTITHTNRLGKTYYLHHGQTKAGKKRYFFSMRIPDNPVDEIPSGSEIYEHPTAQVFLRKMRPKRFTDEELVEVEQGIKRYSKVEHYIVDERANKIVIHLPNQDVDRLQDILSMLSNQKDLAPQWINRLLTFSPMMQFELVDEERRLFLAHRYCFLGRIDDWIVISEPEPLDKLVKQYTRHLGRETFFNLY